MYELITNNVISSLLFIIFLTLILLNFLTKNNSKPIKSKTKSNTLPKPNPIIGHLLAFAGLTGQEIFEWISRIISNSPTLTVVINQPFGKESIFTGNPKNIEHIFKTRFHNYIKGWQYKSVFGELLGNSLFTIDGEMWKFQRQIIAQQFTHKALQKYVDTALEFEVTNRLIPVLEDAAKTGKVVDLQDIFQRFAFDNVCTVAFGYDPGYLTLPLPEPVFTKAFDESITICHDRFHSILPVVWKICKILNIGSEKRLKVLVRRLREFTRSILESSRTNRSNNNNNDDVDDNLLTKLLECDKIDDETVIDHIIGFILAGRDTSSSALTWFFWTLHKNKRVEPLVLADVDAYASKIEAGKPGPGQGQSYFVEALKSMTYVHAALSETMRLYPPVPADLKYAVEDDVLPDGTRVKKGSVVGYFAQSMGWSEKLWGPDWPEYRPERWLTESEDGRGPRFAPRDAYSYPVFMAGPRVCLGKEMAYLQMKSVVAAVLSRFKVVPAAGDGFEPVYMIETVATMHGGFPVRVYHKVDRDNGTVTVDS